MIEKADGEIIGRGAEAVLIRDGKMLKKLRVEKGYRLPEMDERIRKIRTRKEAKILEKAAGLINVPKVIKVDDKTKEIDMEFIPGLKLSESLDGLQERLKICKMIGESIAKLHDAGIIHGDLTTSNMIYNGKELYFVDFGLGFESRKIEDKAVDLHLIKEAFEAKHFNYAKEFFDSVLTGYKESKNYKEVLIRLEKVERRGRYKGAY